MARMNRRTLLQLLGSAPVAAGFVWTEAEALEAHAAAMAEYDAVFRALAQ